MHRFLFLAILTGCMLFGCVSEAHDPDGQGIRWMTWKEAMEASNKEPRKIFIDMYTDWCGWCKRMDATTFKDPDVIDFVNSHFYAVKMDAETMDTLEYKGKLYNFVPGFRANELAATLLNGRMSYPSSVFLDEKLYIISPVPGYMAPAEFLPVLRYFGENHYKTETWEDFISGEK